MMEFDQVIIVCVALLLIGTAGGGQADGRNKGRGKGSMWWGIAKAGEPNNLSPLSGTYLYTDQTVLATLRRKQRRLARENPDVLVAIAKGANQAINECQYQFRNRRWNCSTRNFLRGKNLFGKIVDKGCRETAFIYAITSAAVTHAIARACSEGSIETCNCDYSHHRNRLRATTKPASSASGSGRVRDWEWGGCSDNIGFGIKFSREFVDTGERGKTLREKMNLHNNKAGRLHVQSQMRKECKCHGMSGSCTVKTCWMRLPPFRAIGDALKDRFDGASRVTVGGGGGGGGTDRNKNLSNSNGRSSSNNRSNSNHHHQSGNKSNSKYNSIMSNSIHNSKRDGNNANRSGRKHDKYNFQLKPYNPDHKAPGAKDLVYWESSPGFCERNPKLGIQGTQGRFCNDTSIGVDGCDIMCCGRGHHTEEMVVVERCNCTFHWCCEVKCDVCRTKKIVHTCL